MDCAIKKGWVKEDYHGETQPCGFTAAREGPEQPCVLLEKPHNLDFAFPFVGIDSGRQTQRRTKQFVQPFIYESECFHFKPPVSFFTKEFKFSV
jgi:hypothetical protein